MTEQPEREPSAVERNAPRIEQAARWLWDHRPKSNKAKIQILAAVAVAGVSFGIGALHSGPGAVVRSQVSRQPASQPAATTGPASPTPDPSSWTPGPAPGYGFVGGNPGNTGTTVPAASSSSASPTPVPTVQPEPSSTTIQPGPGPTSPGPNPSE